MFQNVSLITVNLCVMLKSHTHSISHRLRSVEYFILRLLQNMYYTQHGISVSTSSHGRDIWTHIIFEFLPGNCLSCQPKLCHKIFCKNPIQSSLGPLNTLVQSDAFDAEFAQRCQLTFNKKATLPRIKLSALLYFRQYSFHAVMLFNATKSENTSGNITLTQC